MTLKKLGAIANFSVSTVSKALKDDPEISKETKIKIKKLAELYNYIPNMTAKNLKARKTRIIGVIVPNILAYFFAKVLVGIEKEATNQGYQIITCISDESYEKEVKCMETLANGTVDGILMSVSKKTFAKKDYKHIQNVIKRGIPVVQFDRIINEIQGDKIVIDDYMTSYNATKKLINSGCRNNVFVSPIHSTDVGLKRLQGFKSAIKDEIGHNTPKIFHFEDYTKFREDFRIFLKNNNIDGVLASDELSAIYTMNLIKSCGYSVPSDISVIGFTDGILAENSDPPLTTIDQKGVSLGLTAAKKLIDQLNKKDDESITYHTTTLNSCMIHRGSTKFTEA